MFCNNVQVIVIDFEEFQFPDEQQYFGESALLDVEFQTCERPKSSWDICC